MTASTTSGTLHVYGCMCPSCLAGITAPQTPDTANSSEGLTIVSTQASPALPGFTATVTTGSVEA